MCGIVGVFGSGITYTDEKVFKQLLQIDTLRGAHSTGMLITDGIHDIVYKKAVDGYTFTDLKKFDSIMATIAQPSLMLGHNRYATMGAVIDENAHPFEQGSTIMVHNGSLKMGWKSYLHKSSKTEVDSEAICFNIEEHGLEKTVNKLNGAFTLVVYNRKTGELQLCRNSERPLWFCNHKTRDVQYFASEPEMLMLVLGRNNITHEKPVSLREDAIVCYNINKYGNAVEPEYVDCDVEYYKPQAVARGNSISRGVYKAADGYLGELGIDSGTELVIDVASYESTSHGSIKAIGDVYIKATGEKLMKGVAWGVAEFQKDKHDLLQGRCAYWDGNNDRLSITYPTAMSEQDYKDFIALMCEGDDLSLDPDKYENQYCGPDNAIINRREFDALTEHGCCCCGDSLEPLDAFDSWGMLYVGDDDHPVCPDCVDKLGGGKDASVAEKKVNIMKAIAA